MAEGTVNTSWIVENFTPTINTANNFELKSWGTFRCIRIGDIVIISVHGLTNTVGTTGDRTALLFPYRPRLAISAAGVANDKSCIVQCAANNNGGAILISAVAANDSIFFEIVIPIG